METRWAKKEDCAILRKWIRYHKTIRTVKISKRETTDSSQLYDTPVHMEQVDEDTMERGEIARQANY